MEKTTKITKAAPQSNTQRGMKGQTSEPERAMVMVDGPEGGINTLSNVHQTVVTNACGVPT